MAEIEKIKSLIENSVPSGLFSWVKKITIQNAYSGFISQIVTNVPDTERMIAIAFEVENHQSLQTTNLLCTDKNIYMDDINFIKKFGVEAVLYKIPLQSISSISFNEGLLLDDLKLTQEINGVTIKWHWKGMEVSSPFFKKFAWLCQRQVVGFEN